MEEELGPPSIADQQNVSGDDTRMDVQVVCLA